MGGAELGGRLRFADIRLVVGTRPEAIKLAPLAHALSAAGMPPSVILTGQHERLDPAAFGLGGYRCDRLGCAGEEDPHRHVRAVAATLLPRLAEAPALLIVQGDTSSAFGAALAGFTAGVPVAHVEAGLRTHDPSLPWPEEEYRTAIDARAALLFAPTPISAANLQAERVPGEIHVTGNTGIDALLAAEARLPSPCVWERHRPFILVTAHRRESWGDGLRSIAKAVTALAEDADIGVILHPNRHVRAQMRAQLDGRANVQLLNPVDHRQLLALMRDSDLVLSDSGGMQEEAPALGVPMLVLREKTERPEALATGNARLVGTDCDAIVATARALLADPVELARMSRRAFPFGDGRSAPRIAAIVARWLSERADYAASGAISGPSAGRRA